MKVILRVFRGDPCLQRVAVEAHIVLGWLSRGLGKRFALGNFDLRLDDVDACDFFGHRVLDLHAGVHFDEVELAAVHIHQRIRRCPRIHSSHARRSLRPRSQISVRCSSER